MAACLLPVAPRLVLRASSAARCARADGRLAPTTCQSRTSMGTRVISPVWPAAAPSRVAVCSDRGEFAKSKSGVGPPYWGGRNGRRNLAILPSQTTISSATIRARLLEVVTPSRARRGNAFLRSEPIPPKKHNHLQNPQTARHMHQNQPKTPRSSREIIHMNAQTRNRCPGSSTLAPSFVGWYYALWQ